MPSFNALFSLRSAAPVLVVVGAQWGDEGKAKITDLLAEHMAYVVRYQGGANAGHTVQHGQDVFKFHLLPSGLLYGDKMCVIASGTVIDAHILKGEIEAITQRGYSVSGLKVSDRAHVTLPVQRQYDVAKEQHAAQTPGQKIGTTGRGIGPTYTDKIARMGVRVCDLFASAEARTARLLALHQQYQGLFSTLNQAEACPSMAQLEQDCADIAAILAPYVCDTIALLNTAVQQGEAILCEGAQGTLLDVDFGTYPYVTSSNATAGGACTGTGLGPTRIGAVLGVMKAYITRVGEGPFPTEQFGEMGEALCRIGHEVGTTTGRLRRCGWFDAVLGRYSVWVNGLTHVAITKLDVLDSFAEIPFCVAYKHTQTGQLLETLPASLADWAQYEPVYETMPGWQSDTTACRQASDLPNAARAYLARLEQLLQVPVALVSVGPERTQTLAYSHVLTPELSLS